MFHERVDAEIDVQIIVRHTLFLGLCQYEFGKVRLFFAREGNLDSRKHDVFQQHIEVCRRKILVRNVETDGIDTRIEHFQCKGIGFGRIYDIDCLMRQPVVVAAYASQIREFARFCSERFQTFEILGAIVWTDVESFVGPPYQFTLIVGTFEVYRYRRFPRLGRYGREFGKELFTIGFCHNCYN